MGVEQYGRILVYPSSGRLLFATDFHGQLRDFRRLASWFSTRRADGEDVYLLFAGDFVHGPRPGQHGRWLETDRSPALLKAFQALQNEHPGRVHSLLGNHEYGHLGGPLTQKFYRGQDDDVSALCRRLGRTEADAAHALFAQFSLLALSPCGVVFSHAAPNLTIVPDLISRIIHADVHQRDAVIMQLTWPRAVEDTHIEAVLDALSFQGIDPQIAAYGHEIIPTGVDRSMHRQLVVSTSFAIADRHKRVLDVDLAATYSDVSDFREGKELRLLYPQHARKPSEGVGRYC